LGHFTITGARGERGSLLATRKGDSRIAWREDVLPKDSPFELKPVEGGRITGRVEGASAASCQVVVRRDEIRLYAEVDEGGRFTSPALPPGAWTLELRVDGIMRGPCESVAVGSRAVVPTPSQ
jgi:hypothetical protein